MFISKLSIEIFVFLMYFEYVKSIVIEKIEMSNPFNDNLDDNKHGLSKDGKIETCAVTSWGLPRIFEYFLDDFYQISKVEFVVVDQDEFKQNAKIPLQIHLGFNPNGGPNYLCSFTNNTAEGESWSNRRWLRVRCPLVRTNLVVIQDLRFANNHFGICEVSFFGLKSPLTPSVRNPTPNISISTTPSVSISTTPSVSISAPPSVSISAPPSVSISAPPSVSISAPPSVSISAQPSVSISTPPSVSISTPPRVSISTTPSISVSTNAPARPSASITDATPINTSNNTSTTVTVEFNLNYVYVALGCLGFFTLLLIVVLLVAKRRKRRDSAASYYYWSNGTDSSMGQSSPNSHQQPRPEFPLAYPAHLQAPCPLPRGAQSRGLVLQSLQRDSTADPNHYSVVNQPNFPDYVSILDEASEPIYDDCYSRVIIDDCRAPTIRRNPNEPLPKPPNTRFSQLCKKTFDRRPPYGFTS